MDFEKLTRGCFSQIALETILLLILEVTIARKVLPYPQGIKGSIRNLMNKGLFSLYDPALPGRDVKRDDFDVLKYVTVHDSAKNFIIF